MSNPSLLVFAALAVATIATPGPNVLLALHLGARHGLAAASVGIAGAVASDVVLIAATAAGVGSLLAGSPSLFGLIQWLGVAYLATIAIRLLRQDTRRQPAEPAGRTAAPPPHQLFGRSFAVAVTNPKAYVFFSALLVPFVVPEQPLPAQYATMGGVFIVLDAAILLAYACVGQFAGQRLQGRASGWMAKASGAGLLVLAGVLALQRDPT